MDAKKYIYLYVPVFLALCLMHGVESQVTLPSISNFSCSRDVAGRPLNLTIMSGIWYEVARIPNADVMSCLNVTVPAQANETLDLGLEYITSFNNGREAVKETVSFPWDDSTKNSIFILKYSGSAFTVTVTYKVAFTDYRSIVFLCGYAGISPIPLFKVLSRKRELPQKYIDIIQQQADKTGYGSNLHWTEQSPDRCNTAVRPIAGSFIALVLVFLWSFSKW